MSNAKRRHRRRRREWRWRLFIAAAEARLRRDGYVVIDEAHGVQLWAKHSHVTYAADPRWL